MNVYQLESRIRSVGIAYILLFVAGAHYAYLNRWGTQVLFWITFGGLGIWFLIDIFRLNGMVHDFNDPIFDEIDYLERRDYKNHDDFEDNVKYTDRDDFSELRKMREQRSGNLLEDRWKDR